MHLLRFDPETGTLRQDKEFKDEVSGAVGLDFNRASWPHGATGPARPHGVLFLYEAPPEGD